MIRVLIADSYYLSRTGLYTILSSHPELEIVCQSSTSNQAILDITANHPDVALLDIHIKPDGALPVIQFVKNNNLKTLFLLLAGTATDSYIIDLLRAGAAGCILRNETEALMLQSILDVAAEKSPISPEIAREVLIYLRERRNYAVEDPVKTNPLTQREFMVLKLLSEGMQNKFIGIRLNITERTVEAHVRSILKKMNATSRTHAVILASRNGWLENMVSIIT